MPVLQSLRRSIACLLLFAAAGAAGAEPSFLAVHRDNFPDPFILEHKRQYFAYSTNSEGVNLPMITSRDLIAWSDVIDPSRPGKRLDAMPALAPWVQEGRTWAPEVLKIGGRWLLYYTARHRKRDIQCIGVASAPDPRGPFRDASAEPLVCQYDLGGTIDAHPFRDADGQLYLYYKNDGNNPKVLKPSQIWAQRLSPDGLRLTGDAAPLVRNDKHWEWRVVEAPTMVRHAGGYTLFFSGNHFGWEADQRLSNYGTGYAQCQGPMGPCADAPENPWLRSFNDRRAGCLSGPGHPAVFSVGSRQFMAFHAWAATTGCRKAADERYLYIAPLMWKEGKPVLALGLRPAQRPQQR
jgi:beta-xylosidase